METVQTRHIQDSLRLCDHIPERSRTLTDLGSGGGLPGIVLAIARPDLDITLIEADKRKAAFLRAARRRLSLDVEIRDDRIERVPPTKADVVTARALAPLPVLLGYVQRHLDTDGVALLPKGTGWEQEVLSAVGKWSFQHDVVSSRGASPGVILRISNIAGRADGA
jgi:16S rRNA (guanine527-N7)-methyltransferase